MSQYTVGKVAEMTGVTVRTLHHYDAIGLLVPADRSAAGYRLYGDQDLLVLQQILLWTRFGLSLDEVAIMLAAPDFDVRDGLIQARQKLLGERTRLEAIIGSVDRALASLEGKESIMETDLFDGFDPTEHEQEAEERWGETEAYKESARRTKSYTPEDWTAMKAEADACLARFGELATDGVNPASAAGVAAAEAHRLHIDRWFYPCSKETHDNLGKMYTADPRFAATFDAHGEGAAEFATAAIAANLLAG